MIYVDIILPFPVDAYYTYSVPEELSSRIEKGKRVIVPFGSKRFYTGLVKNIHNKKPEKYSVKDILIVIDDTPIFSEKHIAFQEWISSYYMSSLGDVFKASVPSGMRLESHTKIILKNADFHKFPLKDNELIICNQLLNASDVSVISLNEATGLKNSMPYIQNLIDKGILEVEEQISSKYKEKNEQYVRLYADFSELEISQYFESLKRAKQQHKLLLAYLNISQRGIQETELIVKRQDLLKLSGCSSVILQSLCDKKILQIYSQTVSRLEKYNGETKPLNELNEYQSKALLEIKEQFKNYDCVLLNGVTSSGKTEIYTHLIKESISRGEQVLYLLPEIALTTQITKRLQSYFGEDVGVYHSKFSDSERVEIWNNLKGENQYKVILGVRSSVFLPYNNLGLIIVDEEHEASFKQQNVSPKYNARDASLVLAKQYNAKVLLGSATPSIESIYNTKQNKYGYVELKNRYKNIELPEIIISDLGEARYKKSMQGVFGPHLYKEISSAIENNKQVILFQNRRGYAAYMQCKTCSSVVKCKHCDVSLTYHKFENKLICHYCGYKIDLLHKCPSCESIDISVKGFGTERIEEELEKYFKGIKVSRMDLDTAGTKRKLDKLIKDFEQGDIDVLIGTQMVTKGLDFDNVSVVGVLNADSLLNYPDFRAYERTYQLLSQVAGRAGRKGERGKVVIQTTQINNPIIQFVKQGDYYGMYNSQIEERKEFIYPPFYKVIEIELRHTHLDILHSFAQEFSSNLRRVFGVRIFGPHDPLVSKVQKYYIRKILLKIETKASLSRAKKILKDELAVMSTIKKYNSVQVYFDVDPI